MAADTFLKFTFISFHCLLYKVKLNNINLPILLCPEEMMGNNWLFCTRKPPIQLNQPVFAYGFVSAATKTIVCELSFLIPRSNWIVDKLEGTWRNQVILDFSFILAEHWFQVLMVYCFIIGSTYNNIQGKIHVWLWSFCSWRLVLEVFALNFLDIKGKSSSLLDNTEWWSFF